MSIKFIVEKQEFIVDQRIIQTSELFKEIFNDGNYEMVIESSHVSAKAFETIIDYYEFNEYNPTIIEKIDRNPDICFLNQHDKELIMKFSVTEGTELKELINASTYLNMKAFRKLCLARIAFEYAIKIMNVLIIEQFGEQILHLEIYCFVLIIKKSQRQITQYSKTFQLENFNFVLILLD